MEAQCDGQGRNKAHARDLAEAVSEAMEQKASRRLPVPAGSAALLVVVLQGLGHRLVDHEAHVRLVDAHAKSNRGRQNLEKEGKTPPTTTALVIQEDLAHIDKRLNQTYAQPGDPAAAIGPAQRERSKLLHHLLHKLLWGIQYGSSTWWSSVRRDASCSLWPLGAYSPGCLRSSRQDAQIRDGTDPCWRGRRPHRCRLRSVWRPSARCPSASGSRRCRSRRCHSGCGSTPSAALSAPLPDGGFRAIS